MRRFLQSAASLLVPLLLLGTIAIAVRPWGDYPLNDDWWYARAAQRFAATGHMADTPVEVALVGQILISYPVVRAFGLSHLHLRILTLLLSALLVVLLDVVLRYARAGTGARTLALAVLVVNPLFVNLALSFMTEIYGYTVCLVAVLVWFHGRSQADRGAGPSAEDPLLSWPAALAVGLLSAASFWIRQYCVLVLPVCLASAVIGAGLRGEWRRVRHSIPRLAASLAVALAGVAFYLRWSQLNGNLYRRTAPLLDATPELSSTQVGIFMTYMTAFFLPLLVLLAAGHKRNRRLVLGGLVLMIFGFAIAFLLFRTAPADAFFTAGLHAVFPFLSGVVYNACVGPPTLTDVFLLHLPNHPHWPQSAWLAVEAVLLLANGLWIAVFKGTEDVLARRTSRGLPAEGLLFGFLFAGVFFAASLFGSAWHMFDRYYFPCVLGLTMVLAILLADRAQPTRRPAYAVFVAAFAALAFFTTAGVHDYFRWNDARWAQVNSLLAAGVSPANLDGGYEVNGWFLFGQPASVFRRASSQCIGGGCRCTSTWFCFDDSYRIGMNVFDDYQTIGVQQPKFWLTRDYPLLVSRRTPRPELSKEK